MAALSGALDATAVLVVQVGFGTWLRNARGPKVTPERDRAEALRRERLAEAMRANLQRRKAQQRGRVPPAPDAEPVEDG